MATTAEKNKARRVSFDYPTTTPNVVIAVSLAYGKPNYVLSIRPTKLTVEADGRISGREITIGGSDNAAYGVSLVIPDAPARFSRTKLAETYSKIVKCEESPIFNLKMLQVLLAARLTLLDQSPVQRD